MEKVYYNNIECGLVQKLDDNESVIELDAGVEYFDDEFGEYAEPFQRRIVVNNKDLYKYKITKDKVLQELEDYKTKEANEIQKSKQRILNDANKEKREILDEIKKHKEKFKKIEILEEMYNYVTGEYKYFVGIENSYSKLFGIIKSDACNSEHDKNSLASVSFRTKNNYTGDIKDVFKMYLGQYSDDSGSRGEIKGFRTLEEAKTYLVQLIESGKMTIDDYITREYTKWNLESPRVTEYIKINKEKTEEKRQNDIDKLEQQLKDLKK